jgi:hypothetical protein
MPDLVQLQISEESKNPRKEADGPWKDALDFFLEQFMDLFFPDWSKQINWSKKPKPLTPDFPNQFGTEVCDRIFEVELLNGEQEILILHVEIQGQKLNDLPYRMMSYNFSSFKKYEKPVVSIAVYLDKDPLLCPNLFEQIHPFKKEPCHQFWYDTIKIWNYKGKEEELKKTDNIFALIVIAQLAIMGDKNDQELRKNNKRALFREFFNRGLKKETVVQLHKVIDWLIPLDQKHMIMFQKEVKETAQKEKWADWDPVYVSTFEKVAMIKGREESLKHIIDKQIRRRFPHDVTSQYLHLINEADSDTLSNWADNLFTANSIDDVFKNG